MRQTIANLLRKGRSTGRRSLRRRVPRARRRWRVEVVNENTLIRAWSLRLPELRAWIVGGALVAALASLALLLILFTPLGQSIRGHLPGALRSQYVDLALQLDSLNARARVQQRYTDNIIAVLNSQATDSLTHQPRAEATATGVATDSLLPASDNERLFVQQFESRERFNISVLSPIAAEGMVFEAPSRDEDGIGPVTAIYRGTVVGISYNSRGLATVVVQHPNDFLSVYGSLKDVYVGKGAKVTAAQRIGTASSEAPLQFELWRAGSQLDPLKYVNYPEKK